MNRRVCRAIAASLLCASAAAAPLTRADALPSPTLLRSALIVADADATHAALTNAGARILEPPQVYVSRRKAADGRSLQGKVFHAWDPDGNLIELLEAPK